MSDELAIPDPYKRIAAKYATMNAEAVLASIEEGFSFEVQIVVDRAYAFRRAKELGIDRDQIRSAIMRALWHPLLCVAYGQIAPEVVATFAGSATLLKHLARLPMPDQLSMSKQGTVKLLSFAEDGKVTHRNAALDELSTKQLKQVFAVDHVRNEGEQLTHLEQERTEKVMKSRRRKDRFGPFEVDRELQSIRIVVKGNVSKEDCKAAMKAVGWL